MLTLSVGAELAYWSSYAIIIAELEVILYATTNLFNSPFIEQTCCYLLYQANTSMKIGGLSAFGIRSLVIVNKVTCVVSCHPSGHEKSYGVTVLDGKT